MGLVDSFSAEDRVNVKYSDFYRMVRAEAEKALLKNAIDAEVPREQILKMLTGKNDELEEYRKTGLSPEQIYEMDHLYADKCKEVAITSAEKDVLEKQLEDLLKQRDREKSGVALDESATQAETETAEGEEPDKKKRSKKRRDIDTGKILALKKAGWKVKDIAGDMGLEPSTVSQVLYRENQKSKQEQVGDDENPLL